MIFCSTPTFGLEKMLIPGQRVLDDDLLLNAPVLFCSGKTLVPGQCVLDEDLLLNAHVFLGEDASSWAAAFCLGKMLVPGQCVLDDDLLLNAHVLFGEDDVEGEDEVPALTRLLRGGHALALDDLGVLGVDGIFDVDPEDAVVERLHVQLEPGERIDQWDARVVDQIAPLARERGVGLLVNDEDHVLGVPGHVLVALALERHLGARLPPFLHLYL
eukprot:CAMPEP_0198211974 /NCGR_PEP_ID=MMETSP1445-20131203/25449_1 /TAXON_ID=36898 /ORGANISM="Pyramimonas sp., Strain CCMP2087" /LENGTH=214 /DNA_ID=CAMNT_0043886337 /DNA_START=211 /DNA_END=854 /DNA_ORIENTATION=-